jgi:hypothetical protein
MISMFCRPNRGLRGIVPMFLVLLLGFSSPLVYAGEGVKENVKDTAHDVGQGVKKTTKRIGQGTRDTAKSVGQGTKKVVKSVGSTVKEGAGELKRVFTDD